MNFQGQEVCIGTLCHTNSGKRPDNFNQIKCFFVCNSKNAGNSRKNSKDLDSLASHFPLLFLILSYFI
ncbi:hypothetical protein [Leptospira borgpetersenii]|uniref:Uncharacterized protein n=1 Tax=Leptospira borgpetersenii serovar Javanica str. UI 09931 TaxID=1049767 RepID=A0AAV3JDW0_LEPBO|nr:hypothetical protein [Leptospira borgpetersenii]AXX14991.1 hypothetical protein C4Q31_04960 [Leptospira borgpetersenii serovar Ceylonica]EKQ92631.1 hypothetical protein LEP1GSC101_2648 [Leptospira borgpetersenii str. UI 09149]EMN58280.1 hypothetical protein LEP1GSC090_3896 [Leptospira borgpetersenii serovar Javanica str. MK146]EPG58805.1 hypothetical protein LEP1GSC103_0247 [Leptospira borgpetersenii serovar Javanica str. UI 09931]